MFLERYHPRIVRCTVLVSPLLAMVFSSCVMLPANTHWDQRRSLNKYDSLGIDAPVSLPELNGETDKGFSAPDFLTLHSGFIVSGKYIDEDFREKLATSRDNSSKGSLELGFSVPIAKGGSGFGSCAAVTGDGYFLTAAHVLAHDDSYVLYATSNSSETYIKYAPIRVVYKDEQADFAIVKAEVSTPRYLKYRRTPLTEESVLFAGGWIHDKGGGLFLEYGGVPGGNSDFKKVVTTLPMIKGDSGSPLIDQKGRLCGVLSTMRLGVIIKMKPKSTAVMMAPEKVESIISKDRAKH